MTRPYPFAIDSYPFAAMNRAGIVGDVSAGGAPAGRIAIGKAHATWRAGARPDRPKPANPGVGHRLWAAGRWPP